MISRRLLKDRDNRMIRWVALAVVVVLSADTPIWAALQDDPQGQAAKKDEQKAPAAAAPAEAKPTEWGPFTVRSTFEVGYRWKTRYGSEDMYRSQVNLGRGPRLLSSSVSMEGQPHSGKLWDRLYLNMDSWGGDPYNTVRLRAEKSDLYQLDFHYQNIQYFNSIPTFANPLLTGGLQISQHTRDSGRRMVDARLTFWPTALFHPYLSYGKTRALGRGRTTYAAEGDEFVLRTNLRENSDEYRVGVEFGRTKFGGFVEQGYRRTKEDWRLTGIDVLAGGNSPGTVLGRAVFLNDLLRDDHARGSAHISRAFLRWVPHSMVQLDGHATYINADQVFSQDQLYNGSFVSFSDRRVFPSKRDAVQSQAQLPGLLAGGNVLFRPSSKVSIVNSVYIYQFHSDGSGLSGRTLFNALPLSGPQNPQTVTFVEPIGSRIAFNTRRNTLDGTVQLHRFATFRLGYRYQFQEAHLQAKDSPQGERPTLIQSNQHTPLAGLEIKVFSGLQLAAELEKGYTDRVFYRTMPKNFTRLRVHARSQIMKVLRLSGYVNVFGHRHGIEGVDLSGHNRGFGFSISVTPTERIVLSLDYQRSDIDSNLRTLIPQTLTFSRSLYVENANYASGHLELGLPRGASVTLGYSLIDTTGSFPVNFHQPYAQLSIPMSKRISWNSSWRYYGYNEKASWLEDYRTHLYSTGMAFHF